MNSRGWLLACALGAGAWFAFLAACAGRRLPPGTPPPEYEPPLVTPWAPERANVDAGPMSASEHVAAPANSAHAASDTELSLDAGPR